MIDLKHSAVPVGVCPSFRRRAVAQQTLSLVGVSLLAIGCEAVVKKAGPTIAGKSFRLYREQARSYRGQVSHSAIYQTRKPVGANSMICSQGDLYA